MKWRLIELHKRDAYFNTAIDEVICDFVAEGKSPPTIRFWKSTPAVSISYKQNLSKDIDTKECNRLKYDIVRRVSGGRSDFISDNDICYSMFIPANYLSHNHMDVIKNYELIGEKISQALASLWISARLKNKCDIIVTQDKGGKIGNLAQFVRKNVVVVHGKIRYSKNLDSMLSLFYCTSCQDKKHHLSYHYEKLSGAIKSIRDYSEISEAELYHELRYALTENISYFVGDYIREELAAVEKLILEKHKNTVWVNGTGDEPSRGCCDEYWDTVSKILT